MKPQTIFYGTLLASAAFFYAGTAAADAQVVIDQTRALAGQVTAGDAPGFPVTLSAPGVYRLTSDLVVPAGSDGIRIAADNVTLDLDGHTIRSALHCTGAGATLACSGALRGSGVIADPGVRATTVRRGTVRGFGLEGVMLGTDSMVDGVLASGNGTYGIVGYEHTTIAHSTALGNGAHGMLLMYGGGMVIASRALDNKGHGFVVDGDEAQDTALTAEVRQSVASGNGNAGFASFGMPGLWIADTALDNASCFALGRLVRNNVCNGVSPEMPVAVNTSGPPLLTADRRGVTVMPADRAQGQP